MTCLREYSVKRNKEVRRSRCGESLGGKEMNLTWLMDGEHLHLVAALGSASGEEDAWMTPSSSR